MLEIYGRFEKEGVKKERVTMNTNKIAQFLEKPPEEFTKQDLIKFIEAKNIEMLNFRCVGGDGRLKTLNFVIASKAQLDCLLSGGERVDGTNLFAYIDVASSDLYVIPRYKTAYVNPFSPAPTVDMLCSCYDSNGERLPSSPENIVEKASKVLKNSTGLTLEAMGELEYYVLYDNQPLYPVMAQKNYQESPPFCKWERLPQLPASCWESAESLLRDREVYERDGVFPSIVIDWIINKLKSYNDKDLSERLNDKDELKKLIAEYLHCG